MLTSKTKKKIKKYHITRKRMARKTKTIKPQLSITSLQGVAALSVAQGIYFLNAELPWKVYVGIGLLVLAGGIFIVRDYLKLNK